MAFVSKLEEVEESGNKTIRMAKYHGKIVNPDDNGFVINETHNTPSNGDLAKYLKIDALTVIQNNIGKQISKILLKNNNHGKEKS